MSVPLPNHEGASHQLAYSASDDLQNPDKIRNLLKDLREARQAKSREGLRKLDHISLSVGPSSMFLLALWLNVTVTASVLGGDQRNSAFFRQSNACHGKDQL
jgi:hypothetical protein